jgi:O-antigen/teichoic acid export membrane protein
VKLRSLVMRGAGHLAMRQSLGMVISLAGIVLLTRLIGPEAYGLYAAFLGVFTFLSSLSRWGADVFLIRRPPEDGTADLDQAFSFLLVLGTLGALLSWLALPAIEGWWQIDGFGGIGAAFLVGLPLQLVTLVPKARLERLLSYRTVAWVELGAQLSFFLVALPAALRGFGVLAPVAGWWASQLVTAGAYYAVAGYRPRWLWQWHRVREMVRYGLGFSASQWIWQLRELINPLIVGRFAGLEAVGYVALAIRLVNALSFVKTATYRLSIAAFARIQDDKAKLRRAIGEGMRLQVLALAPLLLAFVLVSPLVLPLLFGPEWSPALDVLPFIAASFLANALFNLHSSGLYVYRRNLEVGAFHLVHVTVFATSAALLVPSMGYVGYGWAALASVSSYVAVHAAVVRHIGRPDYAVPGAWAAAFALGLFTPHLGPFALVGVAAVALWPATWHTLWRHWLDLRGLRHG